MKFKYFNAQHLLAPGFKKELTGYHKESNRKEAFLHLIQQNLAEISAQESL